MLPQTDLAWTEVIERAEGTPEQRAEQYRHGFTDGYCNKRLRYQYPGANALERSYLAGYRAGSGRRMDEQADDHDRMCETDC